MNRASEIESILKQLVEGTIDSLQAKDLIKALPKNTGYEPVRIPDCSSVVKEEAVQIKIDTNSILPDSSFYEIEYGDHPVEGAGKFVLKPQKIEAHEKDPIRELFYNMKEISRHYPSPYTDYSRFFDRRIQQDSARIFYNQAQFMKDFEDDYTEQVSFSSYF
ncbi:MAG: hypothetical protein WC319_06340, partial [Candidatus Paceibacterota bacterium]